MADVFTSDFEGATPFANWDTVPASVTQNTSIFHGGAASAKHDGTVGTPLLVEAVAGSPTVLVTQFWFYMPASMPNGYSFDMAQLVCTGFLGLFRISSTTTNQCMMRLTNGVTNADQTGSYADDTWTRVTIRMNVGGTLTADWNLGATEMTQANFGAGTTAFTQFKLGSSSGAAGLVHYTDDVRLSVTSGDYDVYKGAVSSASRLALLGVG